MKKIIIIVLLSISSLFAAEKATQSYKFLKCIELDKNYDIYFIKRIDRLLVIQDSSAKITILDPSTNTKQSFELPINESNPFITDAFFSQDNEGNRLFLAYHGYKIYVISMGYPRLSCNFFIEHNKIHQKDDDCMIITDCDNVTIELSFSKKEDKELLITRKEFSIDRYKNQGSVVSYIHNLKQHHGEIQDCSILNFNLSSIIDTTNKNTLINVADEELLKIMSLYKSPKNWLYCGHQKGVLSIWYPKTLESVWTPELD